MSQRDWTQMTMSAVASRGSTKPCGIADGDDVVVPGRLVVSGAKANDPGRGGLGDLFLVFCDGLVVTEVVGGEDVAPMDPGEVIDAPEPARLHGGGEGVGDGCAVCHRAAGGVRSLSTSPHQCLIF